MRLFTLFAALLSLSALPAHPARALEFGRDTLAFSNDTFWAYEIGHDGSMKMKPRAPGSEPDYTRHCFVMCRTVLQFERRVRFAPSVPRLEEAATRHLLRRIARQPAWTSALPFEKRVSFPGYANLQEFSTAHPRWLQDEMGLWWPTYYRVGNWRMAFGFPRAGQAQVARAAERKLARGEVVAFFMTRFRPLNHCVIAYRSQRDAGGNLQFWAYDPNDAEKPLVLTFDAATRSFAIPPTNYYPGGRVNVFRTYLGPLG